MCRRFLITRVFRVDQDVGGWILLNWILREIRLGGMNWTDLVQDMDQWKALVNTVIKL
jgi:hypothetical protein